MTIPQHFLSALDKADPSWHPVLVKGLEAIAAADPTYLPALAEDSYLPTGLRLFAAFALPLDKVRYVLVGEGPYPRVESASGVGFMDAAVGSLWSDEAGGGLSKRVNRATSLRNFIKMLLVAGGELHESDTAGAALAACASRARGGAAIGTLAELQARLMGHGFLLLNASLVFRPHVAPVKDARAWLPFFATVIEALAACAERPKLVLWGKIAEQLNKLPLVRAMPQAVAEHPYNLSFIGNKDMHALFGPLRLLQRD
jgi:uracil-DNA glycosylase